MQKFILVEHVRVLNSNHTTIIAHATLLEHKKRYGVFAVAYLTFLMIHIAIRWELSAKWDVLYCTCILSADEDTCCSGASATLSWTPTHLSLCDDCKHLHQGRCCLSDCRIRGWCDRDRPRTRCSLKQPWRGRGARTTLYRKTEVLFSGSPLEAWGVNLKGKWIRYWLLPDTLKWRHCCGNYCYMYLLTLSCERLLPYLWQPDVTEHAPLVLITAGQSIFARYLVTKYVLWLLVVTCVNTR